MDQGRIKVDLKAAMTCLLAAAAAADAQQWEAVRAHLDETLEHCNGIIARLDHRGRSRKKIAEE